MPPGTRELIDGLAVPIEPEPGQAIEDGVDRRLRRAFAIGVLDPQQHFSAAPAGIEPVEECSSRPTYVQEARGRRRKTRDDRLGHCRRFDSKSKRARAPRRRAGIDGPSPDSCTTELG